MEIYIFSGVCGYIGDAYIDTEGVNSMNMTIDDLTKEELKFIVSSQMYFKEGDVMVMALNARHKIQFDAYEKEKILAAQALEDYTKFVGRHKDDELSKLPMEELSRGRDMYKDYERHYKRARRHYALCMRCYSEINKLMPKGKGK